VNKCIQTYTSSFFNGSIEVNSAKVGVVGVYDMQTK
jgi:hypothetical protein